MSEILLSNSISAGSLGFLHVGGQVMIQTQDAMARGKVWEISFRDGEVKVTVKASAGLLFFALRPDATVWVE